VGSKHGDASDHITSLGATRHGFRTVITVPSAGQRRSITTPTPTQHRDATARAPDVGRGRQVDRHGTRTRPRALRAAAILLAFTHGLRVSELVTLQWSQFDLGDGVVHIKRVKNGRHSTQPLRDPELRALRQLRRLWPEGQYVLQTETGTPWTEVGFRKTLAQIGKAAGFPWRVHPHQLRHACGYKLANVGTDTRTIQNYMGHRSIQHTVTYTQPAADRFAGLWQD
jgi:type 1 fimbriae regulatory protein FimE